MWGLSRLLPSTLPPRFLHVLLLRILLRFTLPASCSPNQINTESEEGYFQRLCKMWKNGVQWLIEEGVECMVELVDTNRGVVVITKSDDSTKNSCIQGHKYNWYKDNETFQAWVHAPVDSLVQLIPYIDFTSVIPYFGNIVRGTHNLCLHLDIPLSFLKTLERGMWREGRQSWFGSGCAPRLILHVGGFLQRRWKRWVRWQKNIVSFYNNAHGVWEYEVPT